MTRLQPSAGRGGGIFNSGTLTIHNSLINGNSTGDNSFGSNNNGGGIASFSSLTLINTTVSGNSTGAKTAGIGGGVFVFNFATLINTVASVQVVARDDEGRIYDLPVEVLNPMVTVADVTQVVVRLPDNVIGAPRDLRVKVTLRGPGSNEAFIKIGPP